MSRRWQAVIYTAFACAVARAQEPSKGICGFNLEKTTPVITLLQVSCVDYEQWRKVSPEISWPAGQRTNVLIHVSRGESVRITVDGEVKFADLIADPSRGLIAIVQFDGSSHKDLNVKVLTEVK